MPKKGAKLSRQILHKAWVEIKRIRNIELEKAKKVASEISDKTGCSVEVREEEHELMFLNTLILVVSPSWPNVTKINDFIASLPKLKFILSDRREMIDGYFYKTSKPNKNVVGYYLYVRVPQVFDAVGC